LTDSQHSSLADWKVCSSDY